MEDLDIAIFCCPLNKTKAISSNNEIISFEGGEQYSIVNGVPILVSRRNSLFEKESIIKKRNTTQSAEYNYSLKNKIRNYLPSLIYDKGFDKRIGELASRFEGKQVLIIGTGTKYDFYKRTFNMSNVICLDIHMLFKVDIVADAHSLPFQDSSFDLVFASEVLEHTIKPWIAVNEIIRVTRLNGYIYMQTPFCFPYHGIPFDFFRFTPSGLRALFNKCALISYETAGGMGSAAAVFLSELFINQFKNKYLRSGCLMVGRFMFFWLKYFDIRTTGNTTKNVTSPRGLAFTFRKDDYERSEGELLADINDKIGL